jgi:regulator of sigma E protease
MEIFIKIVQLILSLSILVIFHEMGHFTAAKIFKTRVEKFYLFFNPWFSLFKFRRGETEYGIGWLPLGGYVKISGMIDESMDKEQMKQPPQPWEFRSKPAWQRLIIMLGGVTVNLLLAIVIYILILFTWGEQYLPTSEVKYGIVVDSLGYQMGLRDGDKILSIENVAVEDFAAIPKTIILEQARTVQVIRDGKPFEVNIPDDFISKLIKQRKPALFNEQIPFRFPFEVGSFAPGSPAKSAGIEKNDRIIGINDTLLPFFDQFRNYVRGFKGQLITVIVLRTQDTLKYPVKVTEAGMIGIQAKDRLSYFKLKEKSYNILTAIPAGFIKAFENAGAYLKSIKVLFSQEKAYESVGGFITIGSIFPETWNWEAFWSLTAFLSIMLAILNVLPIPALDGGHVLFLLYEITFRRKPSDKFMEYAQYAGMILLFGLLIFANMNDIYKLFMH